MKHHWVKDPENWWFIEASYDNGYMAEIFTSFYDNEREYEDELDSIYTNYRWHVLRHRPPLRAGLSRFHR